MSEISSLKSGLRLFGLLAFSWSAQAVQLAETLETWHQAAYSWQQLAPMGQVGQPGPSQGQLSLLRWNDSDQEPPAPPVAYNRLAHFGGWLSIKDDRSCLDVRNRVLIRDSRREVALKPDNPCKIMAGHWDDPYTGQVLTVPREVDVDHMVPLKNAFVTGAWQWGNDARCLYANYMGFQDHLKSVEKRQNILKSDKDPSQYMPPNREYRCQYLKDWLTIKLIWRLALKVDEARAIRALVQSENCDPRDFVYSTQELRDQRRKIQALVPICAFKNQQPATSPVQ